MSHYIIQFCADVYKSHVFLIAYFLANDVSVTPVKNESNLRWLESNLVQTECMCENYWIFCIPDSFSMQNC